MESSGSPPTILVIEDDPVIRDALNDLFTDEGYKVVPAADGHAAIKVLKETCPDLVTLDLGLPDIPGSKILDIMRRSDAMKHVKVIVLSAQTKIPQRVRGLAQAVIAKPYETRELLSLVERLMSQERVAPV